MRSTHRQLHGMLTFCALTCSLGKTYNVRPDLVFDDASSLKVIMNSAETGYWWKYIPGACTAQAESISKVARAYSFPPFVVSDDGSISTHQAAHSEKGVCIYAASYDHCRFRVGPTGVNRVEFDYSVEGSDCNDRQPSNDPYHPTPWLSFWLNSAEYVGSKVEGDRRTELDALESNGWNGRSKLQFYHNFGGCANGAGNTKICQQRAFAQKFKKTPFRGHVTVTITDEYTVFLSDCKSYGDVNATCPVETTYPTSPSNDKRAFLDISSQKNKIESDALLHFFVIDNWWAPSKRDCSLRISGLRLEGVDFGTCPQQRDDSGDENGGGTEPSSNAALIYVALGAVAVLPATIVASVLVFRRLQGGSVDAYSSLGEGSV